VLLAHGSRFGGYAFYLKARRLHYTYNFLGLDQYTVSSVEEVPAGKATLRLDLTLTAPHQGRATLSANGKTIGEGPIPRLAPITLGLQGALTCGYGGAPAVSDSFKAPFRFTGALEKVTVDLK
jgi:arylsulfatase